MDVVRAGELRAKLERSAHPGKPLTVKVGFDPTAPDLHLGHAVLLRKMKHFQDLGHRVIFLIGDFTGAHRRSDRPIEDAAAAHAGRDRAERRDLPSHRSSSFSIRQDRRRLQQPLARARWAPRAGFVWRARYNVAQMLERRDFKQRYEAGKPIAVHEFLYPLAQAYDSVFLKADVELGGTDQLFNLNVGRDIMPGYGLEPQVVMTTPLARGARRRREDVEEPRQLRRRDRAARRDVRQADVDQRRADVALLPAADRPQRRRDRRRCGDASRPASVCIPSRPRSTWRSASSATFTPLKPRPRAAERVRGAGLRAASWLDRPAGVEVAVPDESIALARLIVEAGLATSTSDAARRSSRAA